MEGISIFTFVPVIKWFVFGFKFSKISEEDSSRDNSNIMISFWSIFTSFYYKFAKSLTLHISKAKEKHKNLVVVNKCQISEYQNYFKKLSCIFLLVSRTIIMNYKWFEKENLCWSGYEVLARQGSVEIRIYSAHQNTCFWVFLFPHIDWGSNVKSHRRPFFRKKVLQRNLAKNSGSNMK